MTNTGAPNKVYRVLVVEDDKKSQDFMVLMLNEMDYDFKIYTASDGVEAINKVSSIIPDFILLDLNLPKVHGMTILEAIRKNSFLESMPIIITSALSESETVRKAVGLGANHYLLKPIEFEMLRDKVDEIMPAAINNHIAYHFNMELMESILEIKMVGYISHLEMSKISDKIAKKVSSLKSKNIKFLFNLEYIDERSVDEDNLSTLMQFFRENKDLTYDNIAFYIYNEELEKPIKTTGATRRVNIFYDYNNALNRLS